MKQIRRWVERFVKDESGETHPLAVTAFGLAFVLPVIGFFLAFIARTQIAFSNGKYSGDRMALAAIVIAPIMQFSTFIVGAVWLLFLVAQTP